MAAAAAISSPATTATRRKQQLRRTPFTHPTSIISAPRALYGSATMVFYLHSRSARPLHLANASARTSFVHTPVLAGKHC
ncbi:hypothetical protein DEO72_LG5g1486 [Vigna unguiculata]|uniref:Uncharacterized protein n=1 Tax=Vigna unguiculata TaxID=3917 RepID=A0A4D6LYI2_VIGUN|nr:hypothetical protein DEO72_LG5g1486 [Vigna unguiculata]